MKRVLLICGLCVLAIFGCRTRGVFDDFRDAVAVDLALATMTDADAPQPSPNPPRPDRCPRCDDTGWITHGDGHRTPCPDCSDGDSGSYGGPLDTWRDAKDLIRKGNDLADRGTALLDAAQRDGKITVDVRLPDTDVSAGGNTSCPGGVCPVPPLTWPAQPAEADPATPSAAPGCAGGVCRPRLLGRWRWRP